MANREIRNTKQNSRGHSSARPPGLRERKKKQIRAHIVATARRLFRTRGYEAATFDDIAAEAGVARRTLLNYFASKEELALSQEHQDFAAFCASFDEAVARGALVGYWRDFLAKSFKKPGEDLKQSLEYKRLVVFQTPALLKAHRDLEFRYLATITAGLKRQLGLAPGVIAPDVTIYAYNLVLAPGVTIEAHIRAGDYKRAVKKGLAVLDDVARQLPTLEIFSRLRAIAL